MRNTRDRRKAMRENRAGEAIRTPDPNFGKSKIFGSTSFLLVPPLAPRAVKRLPKTAKCRRMPLLDLNPVRVEVAIPTQLRFWTECAIVDGQWGAA